MKPDYQPGQLKETDLRHVGRLMARDINYSLGLALAHAQVAVAELR